MQQKDKVACEERPIKTMLDLAAPYNTKDFTNSG